MVNASYPAGRRTAENYALKVGPDDRGADDARRGFESESEKLAPNLVAIAQAQWTAQQKLRPDAKIATKVLDAGDKLECSTCLGSWGDLRRRTWPT